MSYNRVPLAVRANPCKVLDKTLALRTDVAENLLNVGTIVNLGADL